MSYIGLDIGGTNVRYAFTEKFDSKTIDYQKKPFVKTGDSYTEIEKNICDIIIIAPNNVKGIGISLAAVMDRSDGTVKTWPNNPCWNHYELVNHLNNKYDIPIVIEDDANCGAIGEYQPLSATIKNMAYLTIGTGIGCGLILNSSLFLGENGFAGELGHVWTEKDDNERVCSCGNKGCFQSMASGFAVLKEYNLTAKANLESLEQVYELYMQSDPIAVKCLSNMTISISRVIYNLVMCLDITSFIIGGGASHMGAEFVTNIESQVNSRLKLFEREVSIKQAQLGEFSGVHGVLQLLKNKMYKERKNL
jgi:glucokinase